MSDRLFFAGAALAAVAMIALAVIWPQGASDDPAPVPSAQTPAAPAQAQG